MPDGWTLERRAHAAVKIDGGPGNVAGARRTQEGCEIAIVLGFTNASQGHGASHVLVESIELSFSCSPFPLCALEKTNADGIHPDVVGRKFVCQGFCEIQAGRTGERGGQLPGRRCLPAAD